MIRKPNQLGGGSPAKAVPGTATLLCSCIDTYQDPGTRHWLLKVQLDGGKVISGVQMTYAGSRVGTGARPMLPAKGERGLITWPANARQSSACYWLGAVDAYVHGPDTRHPDETAYTHPSGQSEVKDYLGNQVWRYANGDRVIQGDTVNVPAPFYRPQSDRVTRVPWHFTHNDHNRKSEWFYDGMFGGEMFGGALKEEASKLWVKHGQYLMHTSIPRVPFPYSSVIGTQASSQLQVVDKDAQTSLKVTPKRAQIASLAGGTAALTLNGQDGEATLGSSRTVNVHTVRRLSLRANLIHGSAQTIRNDATVIYDGGAEPVAMGRESMINFLALQAGLASLGVFVPIIEVSSECLHSTIGPGVSGSGVAYGPDPEVTPPFESPLHEEARA